VRHLFQKLLLWTGSEKNMKPYEPILRNNERRLRSEKKKHFGYIDDVI